MRWSNVGSCVGLPPAFPPLYGPTHSTLLPSSCTAPPVHCIFCQKPVFLFKRSDSGCAYCETAEENYGGKEEFWVFLSSWGCWTRKMGGDRGKLAKAGCQRCQGWARGSVGRYLLDTYPSVIQPLWCIVCQAGYCGNGEPDPSILPWLPSQTSLFLQFLPTALCQKKTQTQQDPGDHLYFPLTIFLVNCLLAICYAHLLPTIALTDSIKPVGSGLDQLRYASFHSEAAQFIPVHPNHFKMGWKETTLYCIAQVLCRWETARRSKISDIALECARTIY